MNQVFEWTMTPADTASKQMNQVFEWMVTLADTASKQMQDHEERKESLQSLLWDKCKLQSPRCQWVPTGLAETIEPCGAGESDTSGKSVGMCDHNERSLLVSYEVKQASPTV